MMEIISPQLVVTYLNIVLYAICYQLQRPVEPFLVRSLISHGEDPNSNKTNDTNETNQTYGRLTSFFSLLQTIGSPLVGTLLDRIGPRQTSILVYGASALSYGILARASSPTWLYCSKIPTVLQHAFLVGQATVASVEHEKGDDSGDGPGDGSTMRAAALGRMTTAYTIGATVGPALGGYLASEDLYAGARLAVWGSLLSVLLSVVYLTDGKGITETKKKEKISKSSRQTSFFHSLKNTLSLLHHPILTPLLLIKLVNGVSSSAFSTVLPLILVNQLNASPTHLGSMMSASSFSVAIFAAIGITPAMKLVGNRVERLAWVGLGLRGVFIVVLAGIVSSMVANASGLDNQEEPMNGFVFTTAASVAIALSSHMHATSLTTLTTGVVSAEERGSLLGLEHGLFAMARIAGPPLGTMLLSQPSFSPSGSEGSSGFWKKLDSLGSLGLDGLWRVVSLCVIMDIGLMVSLKVWSDHQLSKKGKAKVAETRVNESYQPLATEDHEHDHSD